MDKYDEQIAELTANPGLIEAHWSKGIGLFQFASPYGKGYALDCGCLTMIRSSCKRYVIDTDGNHLDDLSDEIRRDTRIPTDPDDITPAHLPVFAEWQRKLDKLFNRT